MKILFVNLSALKFTVATPDSQPLGGTESCIAYLARQLATNGHDVSLIAQLLDKAPAIIQAVQHYPLGTLKDRIFFAAQKFDVIIACNAPVACPHLRQVSPASRLILWDHVPPDQPSVRNIGNPEFLQSVDCIAYVSEWQKRETEKRFGIDKQSTVIGNGLTPAFATMFSSAEDLLRHKQLRAAYTTIPYRGLPILLKVMQGLKEDLKLDLFSSMRLYQMSDDDYAPLYKEAAQDNRITSYGAVQQKDLARHLKSAAFLTYPCILAETFCIAALEAMAAGAKVIATKLGALETTTMGYADLLPIKSTRPEDLITDYRGALEKNMADYQTAPQAWAERMFEQVQAVNRTCSWEVRAQEWGKLLSH